MTSVVERDIDLPRDRVAALFTDPENSTKWMDDLARYEPIGGEPGLPGSQYRLVPKKGSMVFVATVISRDLPNESRLRLEASNVSVAIAVRFVRLADARTRLISEEIFTFKGLFGTVVGFFAGPAIRRAHRTHMDAFKRFAESL